jgi:hypothetical protein
MLNFDEASVNKTTARKTEHVSCSASAGFELGFAAPIACALPRMDCSLVWAEIFKEFNVYTLCCIEYPCVKNSFQRFLAFECLKAGRLMLVSSLVTRCH